MNILVNSKEKFFITKKGKIFWGLEKRKKKNSGKKKLTETAQL
jgi:hypothetical protein